MSIKVYTGRKLSGIKDFNELQSFINHVRDIVAEKSAYLYRKELMSEYTRKVDSIFYGFEKPKEDANTSIISIVRSEIDNRQKEIIKTLHRDPEVDFELTLNVYIYENELYAFLYTEQNEIQDAFDKIPGVEDYGYWNNVDPDPEIADDVWLRREEVWKAVLYQPNIIWKFNTMDLKVQIYKTAHQEDLTQFLPTEDERIAFVARYLAYKESDKEQLKTSQDIISYLASDEHRNTIKQYKETLTANDLFEITKENINKLRIGDLQATIIK